MTWRPPEAATRREWPRGATAGQCYFCGGLSGPQPVWGKFGVMVCKRHAKRAKAELACVECGERPASGSSLFDNMCVECGEAWRKYTVRANPWSVSG